MFIESIVSFMVSQAERLKHMAVIIANTRTTGLTLLEGATEASREIFIATCDMTALQLNAEDEASGQAEGPKLAPPPRVATRDRRTAARIGDARNQRRPINTGGERASATERLLDHPDAPVAKWVVRMLIDAVYANLIAPGKEERCSWDSEGTDKWGQIYFPIGRGPPDGKIDLSPFIGPL